MIKTFLKSALPSFKKSPKTLKEANNATTSVICSKQQIIQTTLRSEPII